MKKMYKFRWDVRRMGCVEGVFVADESEVEAAIGKDVYFGEILGKHSEIFGTLDAEDLAVLTDDQEFIAKAEQYGIARSGYNPLNYLREDQGDE